ncbi:MAG: hypothetical protein VCB25_08845 [Myxococcota bacterium]
MPSHIARKNSLITVVSGMPRSGTSMMMQMLAAADFKIHSDRQRGADMDNPKGYFELEATRRLAKDAAFLAESVGKVVKIVGPLLGLLPNEYRYRVIFIERDIREMLASQETLIERAGPSQRAEPDRKALSRAFGNRIEQVKRELDDSENFQVYYVSHRFVLESPFEASLEIVEFLKGTGNSLPETWRFVGQAEIVKRMARIVDRRLYRQRQSLDSLGARRDG